MSASDQVAAIAEIVLNRLVDLDPWVREQLSGIDDRTVDVELQDLSMHLRLRINGSRFQAETVDSEAATVTLSGGSVRFLRAALDPNLRGAGLAAAGIDVRGDVDTIEAISEALMNADVDLEEPLSKYIGDVAAHRVGDALRGLFGWTRRSAGTVAEDSLRYLRDESGDIVHRDQMEAWMRDVDELTMAVDRTEARLRRLADQVTGK